MPYIVVNSERQETDFRELSGPLVIGRAPDCELAVRDILLSRRHCRIERSPQGWVLIDLKSKNGTVVNGEKLAEPRVLRDNDVVRMGRSRMVFRTGEPDLEEMRSPGPRPVDPNEALAGTLAGFTLMEAGEFKAPANMPAPQPRPRDPAAFEREELHEMLTAIASSSWDSIYAESRKPVTGESKSGAAVLERGRARPIRPRSPIDLSLQASPVPAPPIVAAMPRKQNALPVAPIVAGIFLGLGLLSMGLWQDSPPAAPPLAKPAGITETPRARFGAIDQVAWTEVAKAAAVRLPGIAW
jgi:predicted component of type VI protein secretion system